MINISLSDLDKGNIYEKTLQLMENICDEYSLHNDFGVLSTANQQVVDYLLSEHPNFSIDFRCNIDSDKIVFLYDSYISIFREFEQFDEDKILDSLSDNLVYEFDYKQLSFTIHVKPKFERPRLVNQSVVINHYQL